jgi:hypothetical protein
MIENQRKWFKDKAGTEAPALVNRSANRLGARGHGL